MHGKEGVKSTCKKVIKKILPVQQKSDSEKIRPDVKLDVRMQTPVKSEEIFNEISDMIIEIAEETGNSYTCKKTDKAEPIKTSPNLEKQVQEVCNRNNISSTIMPSWAGHDVAHISTTEKLLLFIKSTGGSHRPEENTTKEDIKKGITALEGTVIEDINTVHKVVNQIEYMENTPIEKILKDVDKKSKKSAIRLLLFKMIDAKKLGINPSQNLQNKIKNEIASNRDQDIFINY